MRLALVLLALLPVLVSCSKLSAGVYWADTFAFTRIDDYFDLDSAQTEAAKEEFNSLFKEIRREEFPKLASLLEEGVASVEKGELGKDALNRWVGRFQSLFRTALSRFEPLGHRLVEQQAAAGFARFDEEFSRAHKKAREKYGDPEKAKKEARKRLERLIGETFGSLTEAQEKMLDAELAGNPPPSLLRNESRKELFENFRAVREKPEERKIFLQRYFSDWMGLQTPAYRTAQEKHQEGLISLFAKLLETASQEQREHLAGNFRNRAEELRKLSKVK